MKTILSKQGYLIPINDDNKDNKDIIINIKKELSVKPIIPFQYSFIKKQPPIIEVFQEFENYLSVPKYYGLSKFGPPYKNREVDGTKINIEFKGTLRDTQKEIINNVLPHINNINGGVLCLPCAAGKTVLSLYLMGKSKHTLILGPSTSLISVSLPTVPTNGILFHLPITRSPILYLPEYRFALKYSAKLAIIA
jgi:hypothetical protein